MPQTEITSQAYSPDFFSGQAGGSSKSASVVVPIVLANMTVSSVVDVGCGVGPWAARFLACGVQDVIGYDGDYVDRSQLLIPAARFRPHDLLEPIVSDRTFDLAVCLEVAEHLPASRAEGLVADLTRLAPCVLFSAAIPGQGGTAHVNEQPLSYWARIFSGRGYTSADVVRHAIWENPDVELWYRQNIVVFAREGHPILQRNFPRALDLVHPALFEARLRELPTLGSLIRAFPGTVSRSLRTRFRRLMGN